MTAGTYDFVIEQGASFLQSYLIQDQNGNPLNLTGCSAAMQVRAAAGDPVAILSLTTADGSLVIDGPADTITPVVSLEKLTDITPGAYVYDLKLTDLGGEVFRLLQGKVTITQEVTTI